MGGNHINPAVKAVLLVIGTGGKKQGVSRLIGNTIAETQAPEAVDPEELAVGLLQSTVKLTGYEFISTNGPISEITDE